MSMDKKFMKCSANLPLNEAAKLLIGVGKRNLIVVDHSNLVLGTISASDILKRILNNSGNILMDVVGDVMEKKYIFLYKGCNKDEIINKFKLHNIFYLPIVDEKYKLIDMVFLTDFLD